MQYRNGTKMQEKEEGCLWRAKRSERLPLSEDLKRFRTKLCEVSGDPYEKEVSKHSNL